MDAIVRLMIHHADGDITPMTLALFGGTSVPCEIIPGLVSIELCGVDPIEPDPAKAFHGHLDSCERCRTRPFDLCAIGDSLLRKRDGL